MPIDKVLIFDLKGQYAHFKKYYTTTSPLTFSIPPKTVLYGVIGAILGLNKEKNKQDYYLNYFQDKTCFLGIRLLNSIKKTRIPLNLIDTKRAIMMSKIKSRTQIRTEFVVDPHYRIYFYHKDNNFYNSFKDCLKNHYSHYSISLGLSENLANYKYQGEEKVLEVEENNDYLGIKTVLPIKKDLIKKGDIDFSQKGHEYFTEKIALEMKPDREVIEYCNILYERNTYSIYAKPRRYYRLESGENIILF